MDRLTPARTHVLLLLTESTGVTAWDTIKGLGLGLELEFYTLVIFIRVVKQQQNIASL